MKFRVTITETITEVRQYDVETNTPELAAQLARHRYVDQGINPVVGVQISVEERDYEVGPQSVGSIIDKDGPLFISRFSDSEVEEMPIPSTYDWTITKGIFEKDLFGIQGPSNGALTRTQIIKHKKAKRFRVLDGDNEVYYEGMVVMGEDCSGFEPLNDYGRGALGATAIEYWAEGEWRGL